VLVELLLGVAPASPSDSDKSITREQWQFIQGCWSEIPKTRRTTNEALEFVDVNLALCVPFRAVFLTTTEMHSRSSKTDSSKSRLVLSRRDFSPGDMLPPGQYARLLLSRLRWTFFQIYKRVWQSVCVARGILRRLLRYAKSNTRCRFSFTGSGCCFCHFKRHF
jgi:hypothetical protein